MSAAAAPGLPAPPVAPPLDGVTILDLTRLLPGGALTRLLADLGATVIKVERPGRGDEIRADGPPLDGTTATHAFLDRGKRSVALDLKSAAGRDAVLALAVTADAVVESFRPGVADRLGLGWDALRAVNPAIVSCSVNGYGSDGPLALAAGHDIGYCARAGVLHSSGDAEHGPGAFGAQLADITGGTLGAVGLLAALFRARATGTGDRIEVALADAALWAAGIHAAGAFAAGSAGGPESSPLNGAAPCYRAYRCADGRFLAVGALEPQFWDAFVDVVGDADWRERHFDRTLTPVVAARLAERSAAEWLERLEGRDACVELVQTYDEARQDPQFRASGIVELAADGSARVGRPIRTASPAPELRPAAPEVGADGAAVLAAAGLVVPT